MLRTLNAENLRTCPRQQLVVAPGEASNLFAFLNLKTQYVLREPEKTSRVSKV